MSAARIYGDWGSTRLRLWRLRDGAIDGRSDGPGIVGLQSPPADVLCEALAPWLSEGVPAGITLCGMAGARGGLREARYSECPVAAAEWVEHAAAFDLDGLPIRIAAGCAVTRHDGADDVMRGEETQVFGALALNPALGEDRQTFILPGTHSKWVTVENGRIVDLRTFMTGELFALMQTSSLLAGSAPGEDDDGFAAGLARAESCAMPGALFTARAAQLRHGRSPQWARGFLSGLLIGGELAEMRTIGDLSAAVTLIGDAALVRRYDHALTALGVSTGTMDGAACALAGLELFDAYD